MTRTGGCLCGAIRYEVDGEPSVAVHCHCRMCQKSAGAGFISWATFRETAFRYTGQPASFYRSSSSAQREFCPRCGCQIVFRGDTTPTVDVAIATLDESDALAPVANTWVGSRRAWAHGFDAALPDLQGEWPDGS